MAYRPCIIEWIGRDGRLRVSFLGVGIRNSLKPNPTCASEEFTDIILRGDRLETGKIGPIHLTERNIGCGVVGILEEERQEDVSKHAACGR